jgi:hypothetical protein
VEGREIVVWGQGGRKGVIFTLSHVIFPRFKISKVSHLKICFRSHSVCIKSFDYFVDCYTLSLWLTMNAVR